MVPAMHSVLWGRWRELGLWHMATLSLLVNKILLTVQVSRVSRPLLYIGVPIFTFAVPYGNYGCRGGNMYKAFQYVVSNDGIDSSDYYPYSESVRTIHNYQ